MKKDFPDNKQRVAVCLSQFRKGQKGVVMETKYFDSQFELKDLDDMTGEFEGLAAIFNKADSYDDVIIPGAFRKSLHTHPKKKVKMLHEHKRDKPIGIWDELKEVDEGLFARGHLLTALPTAQEVLLLMKEGLIDSMSIGFRTIVERFDTKKKVRELLEIGLMEISLVLFPAQEDALISSVKYLSPDEIENKHDLENALRDAGFSQSTSKFICAGWTPPARRNVEGGQEHVESLSRLSAIISSVTQGGQHG